MVDHHESMQVLPEASTSHSAQYPLYRIPLNGYAMRNRLNVTYETTSTGPAEYSLWTATVFRMCAFPPASLGLRAHVYVIRI